MTVEEQLEIIHNMVAHQERETMLFTELREDMIRSDFIIIALNIATYQWQ